MKSSGFLKTPFGVCFQLAGDYGSPAAPGCFMGMSSSRTILIAFQLIASGIFIYQRQNTCN